MVKPRLLGKTTRMSFAKNDEVLEMPNLIEVQKKSFEDFITKDIKTVLEDISPMTDYSGNLVIDFIDYSLSDPPKYGVEECKERDVNYAAPFKVLVRLNNKVTGELKEQEIYMGDFPMMTDSGTFIINGAERVIVSQIVRSPGIYYEAAEDKSGKSLFSATVIPYRGAWLEYETDSSDVFYVRIDKNRKLPITVLLRAFGLATNEKITDLFGEEPMLTATLEKDLMQQEAEKNGTNPDEEALKEIYKKLRPGEPPIVDSAVTLINNLFFDPKRYDISPVGRYKFNKKLSLSRRISGYTLARAAVSPVTGEVLFPEGQLLSREDAETLENAGVWSVYIYAVNEEDGTKQEVRVFTNKMVDASKLLPYTNEELGLGERVQLDVLLEVIAASGTEDKDALRRALAARRDELIPKHITVDDIFASVNYLLALSHGIGKTDDIDHLGNRRLRSVGELLLNQLRIGFSRMDKIVKEKMTTQDIETVTPQSLINIRPIVSAIRDFFGSSPLSQFMDQTNPLSELTHKRRLSALGPGGLSRDRASFEVRDVHYTHYGRMCPIETPEGPNIGLISYLATFAKVNPFGFIAAPYRVVRGGVVTKEVRYITADEEDEYVVATANEPLDEKGRFVNRKIVARHREEIGEYEANKIDLMDVSAKMVVSVATAMIPFLENDDNTRALMGSNMQKQAVPLMVSEAPFVATGMEYKAAYDSGVVVIARNSGIVKSVTADEIAAKITADTTPNQLYNMLLAALGNAEDSVAQLTKEISTGITYYIESKYSISSDVQKYYVYLLFQSFSEQLSGNEEPVLTIYVSGKPAKPSDGTYKNAIKYFKKDYLDARITDLQDKARKASPRGEIVNYALDSVLTAEEMTAWVDRIYARLVDGKFLTDEMNQTDEAKAQLRADIEAYIRYQYCEEALTKVNANTTPKFNVSEVYGDDLYTSSEQIKALLRYFVTNLSEITEKDIEEMIKTGTKTEEEEIEDPSKYLSADGRIVSVTYGSKKSDGSYENYKTFLLNYNNFAVSVRYDDVTYTIPAYGYVVVMH